MTTNIKHIDYVRLLLDYLIIGKSSTDQFPQVEGMHRRTFDRLSDVVMEARHDEERAVRIMLRRVIPELRFRN